MWETESEDEPDGGRENLGSARPEESKRDSSTAQADSFADERGGKASACAGPAGGGQAE